MPKVTLRRVLEALTNNTSGSASSSSGAAGKKEPNFGENLSEAQFQPCKVSNRNVQSIYVINCDRLTETGKQ